MSRHAHWWRPVRVVIGAALMGFCWFLLTPSSAQADTGSTGLLGATTSVVTEAVDTSTAKVATTTKAATDGGAATVSTTVTAVASTTAETPVAEPVKATAATVVGETVGTDRTNRAGPADVATTTPTIAAANSVVDDRLAGLRSQRAELAEAAMAEAAAPVSVTTPARSLVTAVVTMATARPGWPALPAQPLPYLASAFAVGAVGSSFSGRGSLSPVDAVLPAVSRLPVTAADAMRSLAARARPGPVLIPGTCPD